MAQIDYLESGGKRGACLKFSRAVALHRDIWTSTTWAEQHPLLWEVLDAATQLPGSNWRWFVGGPIDFVTRSMSLMTPRGKQRYRTLLGVVTAGERAGFPANFANVYTSGALLASLSAGEAHSNACPRSN